MENNMIRISFADVAAQDKKLGEQDNGHHYDDTFEDGRFLDEASEQVLSLLASYGKLSMYQDENGVAQGYEYDPHFLGAAEFITSLVDTAYEKDIFSDEISQQMWDFFGLSGDDDVDYSGSYVWGLIQVLKSFPQV